MDPEKSQLTSYLRMMTKVQEDHGQGHLSVSGYVLRNGRMFESCPLTPEEQRYIDRSEWRKHRIKECYHNAQMTAITMPPQEEMTLLYAEGFISLGMEYGINHAWLSLNGKIVDTTMRIRLGSQILNQLGNRPGTRPEDRHDLDRPIGIIPDGWEYYGVEFDHRECAHSLEHGRMTPLIDDWECGFPMQKRDRQPDERE